MSDLAQFMSSVKSMYTQVATVEQELNQGIQSLSQKLTQSANAIGLSPELKIQSDLPKSISEYILAHMKAKSNEYCQQNKFWSLNGQTLSDSDIAYACSINERNYVSLKWRLLATWEDFVQLAKEVRYPTTYAELQPILKLVKACQAPSTICERQHTNQSQELSKIPYIEQPSKSALPLTSNQMPLAPSSSWNPSQLPLAPNVSLSRNLSQPPNPSSSGIQIKITD